MYRKTTIFIVLLSIGYPLHGILLECNLFNNSPLLYLLDLDACMKNSGVTQQIGNILYSKNFLSSVTPHGCVNGSNNERPTQPAEGYQSFEGQWVWIPNAVGATDGIWYWILRTHSYYLSIFIR